MKMTYREIIEKNQMYIASPIGTSMLPLIREGLDTVKLVKRQGRCHKYDVVMYQRSNGTYVMHRIVKVKKDSYVLCGDNQVHLEFGITDDMIIGVMEGIYKGEEYIPVTDKKYLKYSKKIVRTRLIRYFKYLLHKIIKKL